jgi:tRNA(adenine34) deaminase
MSQHEQYVRRCIELGREALRTGDSPVGSMIVRDGVIIAEASEGVRARGDVTAHAEIEALRSASHTLGSLDLTGCTLYTSVEPCPMCAYAIRLARVTEVVSGTAAPGGEGGISGDAVLSDRHLLPGRTPPAVVRGVLARECRALLDDRAPHRRDPSPRHR